MFPIKPPLPVLTQSLRTFRRAIAHEKRLSCQSTRFILSYTSPLYRTRREETRPCASESISDIVSAAPKFFMQPFILS